MTAPRCRADRDGDCGWSSCPQLADREPRATGRHCPLDVQHDDWGDPEPRDLARRDEYLRRHQPTPALPARATQHSEETTK